MIDPEDTTPDERDMAAEFGVTVDEVRALRSTARAWADQNRPWWRRLFDRRRK